MGCELLRPHEAEQPQVPALDAVRRRHGLVTAPPGERPPPDGLVVVGPDEVIVCTFTNTKLATITIEKTSDPAGGTGFGFTATPPVGDPALFTLDDGGSQSFD